MTNKEISATFKLLSKVMEIHGENDFKTRSYSIAAFYIDQLTDSLADMSPQDISKLKGIGPAISDKISELLNTGELSLLNKYLEKTPKGILEILKLKGIGGKKIAVLWKELGIESLGELLEASKENKIAKIKGFGAKTQATIIESIEYYHSNKQKFLYAAVEDEANTMLDMLQEQLEGIYLSLTGEIRRRSIVVPGIELIIGNNDEATREVVRKQQFLIIQKEGDIFMEGSTVIGTPFIIYFSPPQKYFAHLFLTTGSEEHTGRIELRNEPYESEEDIYIKSNLQYIQPELREGLGEIDLAGKNEIPELASLSDMKGMLHAHSTYSDGVESLENMAKACIEQGLEYLGITDHSKSAFYAGGLTEEKVKKQHEEIDRLNEKYAPFKIFKGIESDILNDGSLDYNDEILASFDFVIASIHSNQKMTEAKAMERLFNAARNPYTTIMGHPSGRLLLRREGYPVDFKTLIEVCAEYGTSIEINANPNRLDMDWRWVPYAIQKGLKIAVNPDAHSIRGMEDTYYGMLVARKGMLSKKDLLNHLSREEFEKFIKHQREMKLAKV